MALLTTCAWTKLAAEYERVRDDSERLKVFVNTILGEAWREELDAIDEGELRGRAEAFSLDAIPSGVLALTCGVDCADDRLEAVIVGWSREGAAFVLGHEVIWGAIDEDLTWRQLDDILRMRWDHPLGNTLGIDACAVDGGDGGHLDSVLAFCRSRAAARVMCIKGAPGFGRPSIQASKSKMKGGGRLWIVGSDSLKARLFDQLRRGTTIRFSATLEPVFYEQLASERRVVHVVRGRPVARFERIKGMRAEALDAMVYALAAKSALLLTSAAFSQREDTLRLLERAKPTPSVIRSKWMDRMGGEPW